jgi:hypothetical protein
MYFLDMGSGLFMDASNWFTDVAHTVSAGRTPINGDDLWMDSQFTDTAPTLTINSYNGYGPASASQTAALHVVSTGGVYMSYGVWGGSNDLGCVGYFSGTASMASYPIITGTEWTGSCEFQDTSNNNGQVSIHAYFYDSSFNNANGSVYVPYFYDTSTNQGGFADAWFYNNSYNGAGFGGNSAQFFDTSYNSGTLNMGTSTFNDYAYNDTSGSCNGTTEFYDSASNNGYVGYGSYYDSSADFGSTYSAYFYNYASTQSGSTGYGYWYDSSANNSTNVYDASFAGSSANYTGTCDVNATFEGYSYNGATVSGSATFYDIAENSGSGTIGTDGIFNNSSKNFGLVNGDGYFYDSSDQLGTVLGTTTCSTTGTCP